MITFLKDNGYPMNLFIETGDYKDPENDFIGYSSSAFDEDENLIAEFTHAHLNGRFTWALGFFEGLKYFDIDRFRPDWETQTKGPDLPIIEGEESNLDVGDWIVTKNGFVKKILMDDGQPDLTFEDIEPNIGVPSGTFRYSPQAHVGETQDTTIHQGTSLTLSVSVGGKANIYQWIKDGFEITGADSNSYTIISANSTDAGSYICRIRNTIATQLTLFSQPNNVKVSSEPPPGKEREIRNPMTKRAPIKPPILFMSIRVSPKGPMPTKEVTSN